MDPNGDYNQRGGETMTLEKSESQTCGKTCGSKSCKGRVKFSKPSSLKKCPGIGVGCVAKEERSPEDRAIANVWLTTGRGDRNWFKKKKDGGSSFENEGIGYRGYFVPSP